jgi:hypothetical protein
MPISSVLAYITETIITEKYELVKNYNICNNSVIQNIDCVHN